MGARPGLEQLRQPGGGALRQRGERDVEALGQVGDQDPLGAGVVHGRQACPCRVAPGVRSRRSPGCRPAHRGPRSGGRRTPRTAPPTQRRTRPAPRSGRRPGPGPWSSHRPSGRRPGRPVRRRPRARCGGGRRRAWSRARARRLASRGATTRSRDSPRWSSPAPGPMTPPGSSRADDACAARPRRRSRSASRARPVRPGAGRAPGSRWRGSRGRDSRTPCIRRRRPPARPRQPPPAPAGVRGPRRRPRRPRHPCPLRDAPAREVSGRERPAGPGRPARAPR